MTNLCLDHLRKRKVRKKESTLLVDEFGRPVIRMEVVPEERSRKGIPSVTC